MRILLGDFVSLFYPNLCLACDNSLYKGEATLCTFCLYHLPKTNFHLYRDNPVARHFWGKVNLQAASSYFYFNKGQKVQQLIHNFKYKGKKEVGVKVGEMFGNEIKKSGCFDDIDIIVPVPLHISRMRVRGYNQSDFFAQGLSQVIGAPAKTSVITRKRKTATQTKKHRFERYENVKDVFEVVDSTSLTGKHILLVDDVITTGSTLASSAETILKVENTKVSVASMAFAYH